MFHVVWGTRSAGCGAVQMEKVWVTAMKLERLVSVARLVGFEPRPDGLR